jgi:hypothetical protein
MQPRRKRRFSAKRADLAEQLQESFLRQVLGFGRIRRHTQAQRIHTPPVLVVESLERFRVPLLRLSDGLGFVKFVALSLGWVGQVAFSGRNWSDAANYLYVVWLAVG